MDRSWGLSGQSFDAAIIGGGINGASSAQHLRAQGYTVALFEKRDFASGTTGRSSRILHWGARFLAPKRSAMEHIRSPLNFLKQLRSARTIYRDWNEYAETIPEYLNPVRLTHPFWSDLKVAGWQLDLSCFLVGGADCRDRVKYKRHSATRLPAGTPKFASPDKLRHLVEFDDYQFIWPERICIDAVLDAERMGATVRNYVEVCQVSRDGDAWRLDLFDHLDDKAFAISARSVVNTTGAWIDDVVARTEIADRSNIRRKIIRPKGVHIMARLPPAYRGKGIIDQNSKGGSLFVLPWGDLHYIGPTETIYSGNPDEVVPDEDDVDFILHEIGNRLPDLKLRRADILFGWAGLRPTTYKEGSPLGDKSVAGVVHDMGEEGLPNYYSVTWGTINQHRATAAAVVSRITSSSTPSSSPVAISYKAQSKLARSVIVEGNYSLNEDAIIKAVRDEHAQDLVDVLFRRTPYGWGPHLTRKQVGEAVEMMSKVTRWNENQKLNQVEHFIEYVEKYHLYTIG